MSFSLVLMHANILKIRHYVFSGLQCFSFSTTLYLAQLSSTKLLPSSLYLQNEIMSKAWCCYHHVSSYGSQHLNSDMYGTVVIFFVKKRSDLFSSCQKSFFQVCCFTVIVCGKLLILFWAHSLKSGSWPFLGTFVLFWGGWKTKKCFVWCPMLGMLL